jgi:hypothetical protein
MAVAMIDILTSSTATTAAATRSVAAATTAVAAAAISQLYKQTVHAAYGTSLQASAASCLACCQP